MGKVLVIAPHPDDETLCCGGTIQIFKRKGYEIKVVIVTDGRYGAPSEELKGKRELVEIRKREALNAIKELGVNEVEFLDFEDSKVSERVEEVEEVLLRFLRGVDVVFSPIVFDSHPDHSAIGGIIERLYPRAYFYLIWGSPNISWRKVRFDIREFKGIKLKALYEYKSQIGGLPLDRFTGDYESFWVRD